MSTSSDSSTRKSEYFTDPESAAEMARLSKQARLLTEEMGGALVEIADLTRVHDILDVACGPGEWVLEVAAQYPDKQVLGVDVSQLMTSYAQFQANQRGLSNAQFRIMDILQPLELPDHSFDMINIRLIGSFMFRAIDSWPKLMRECVRVVRPGGIIRLTDCEWVISNSPMCERLFGLCTRALKQAGNTFSPDGRHIGITPMLGRFLRDAGCCNVQHRAFAVDGSSGMSAHQSIYENMMVFLKQMQPLLLQTNVATAEEADILYNRALEEMRSPNYTCIWYYLTVWGETKTHA